ncbi:hypothetical protein [Alcanivorax sp.]|uniref:hypothetical protein n=1 Tax=Alcanivorax sp. TaxID=1872427 RepID=UPI0025C2C223|nr:hypothetical protein [Alcanivorax sp.]
MGFMDTSSESSSANASGDEQTSQAGNNQGFNIDGPRVTGSGKYVTNVVTTETKDLSNNQGMIVDGSSNQITVTDHGAVGAAFDFGQEAMTASYGFGADALFFADQASERAASQSLEAMGTVAEIGKSQQEAAAETNKEIGRLAESLATDGAGRNKTLIVVALVGVAGIGAIVLLTKAKK